MRVKLSRRGRWAVPATALAVTGAVIAGLQIPAAQASPALPARTPAQLLAQVAADANVPPLTGTVVETTSLGLPALPQAANPASLASLITGSHTVNVYYASAQHFRLQVPQSMAETDVIRDNNKLWLWESTSNSVTEYTWAEGALQHKKAPTGPVLTPQQAAGAILKAVGKTTIVKVQSNVLVAGEAAYQLVLAPKDHRSLIGQVVIAVDGKYGFPLRVQVFAKGARSPAFQVGFTQLQLVNPAPANLNFTPPPGATVRVVNLGKGAVQGGRQPSGSPAPAGVGTYGSGWLTVVAFPQQELTPSFGTGRASSAAPPASPSGMGAIGGESQAVLNALIGSAKPVSGPWGSGTLLQTSLVSMLITGGEVYVGAVQPSVLEAAVGHTSAG